MSEIYLEKWERQKKEENKQDELKKEYTAENNRIIENVEARKTAALAKPDSAARTVETLNQFEEELARRLEKNEQYYKSRGLKEWTIGDRVHVK
ncbi:hypothetical protein MUP05_03535 [Candidatus Bathyarchaeota archaeon]|nr:hypothetical protein [Candidatus Bathyarchaeota archaeon]